MVIDMKKILLIFLTVVLMAASAVSLAEEAVPQDLSLPVKVLMLPKFEVAESSGGVPGVAP